MKDAIALHPFHFKVDVMSFYDVLKVDPSKKFSLKQVNPAETLSFEENAAKAKLKRNLRSIDLLQEKLYAEDKQALLVVIQAMDAGGKDSTIKAITEGLNPQGVLVSSFKAPSSEELSHDFLWRIHQQAPPKGHIGIFNRSHYEDVLVVKVHNWAPEKLIRKRYGHINTFEQMLADHGTRVLKFMLHISPEYQLEQFKERIEDPKKHWKFNPADLEERKHWSAYMKAFEEMLNRCSTDEAPWYVIPSENKWFRTMVISEIIKDTLKKMKPKFPKPYFNPEEFRRLLSPAGEISPKTSAEPASNDQHTP